MYITVTTDCSFSGSQVKLTYEGETYRVMATNKANVICDFTLQTDSVTVYELTINKNDAADGSCYMDVCIHIYSSAYWMGHSRCYRPWYHEKCNNCYIFRRIKALYLLTSYVHQYRCQRIIYLSERHPWLSMQFAFLSIVFSCFIFILYHNFIDFTAATRSVVQR